MDPASHDEDNMAELLGGRWYSTRRTCQPVRRGAHLPMRAIAERITWRAEYNRAVVAATGLHRVTKLRQLRKPPELGDDRE
jgi:hypothetical protein